MLTDSWTRRPFNSNSSIQPNVGRTNRVKIGKTNTTVKFRARRFLSGLKRRSFPSHPKTRRSLRRITRVGPAPRLRGMRSMERAPPPERRRRRPRHLAVDIGRESNPHGTEVDEASWRKHVGRLAPRPNAWTVLAAATLVQACGRAVAARPLTVRSKRTSVPVHTCRILSLVPSFPCTPFLCLANRSVLSSSGAAAAAAAVVYRCTIDT